MPRGEGVGRPPRRQRRNSGAARDLGVARARQVHRDVGHDPRRPRRQDEDPVRQHHRLAHRMGDQQRRRAPRLPDAGAGPGRAGAGSARPRRRTARREAAAAAASPGPRDGRALPHPARERGGARVGEAVEADQRGSARPPRRGRPARRASFSASSMLPRTVRQGSSDGSWKATDEAGARSDRGGGAPPIMISPRRSAPRAPRSCAAAWTCRSPTARPARWSARPRTSGRAAGPPRPRPGRSWRGRGRRCRAAGPSGQAPWTSSRIERSQRSGVTVRPAAPASRYWRRPSRRSTSRSRSRR